MEAVQNENEEFVSLLLEQPGIDVNAKDNVGQTAVHHAANEWCGTGNPAILRMLLDFPDIDREAQSVLEKTPLMQCIVYGNAALLKEFLKLHILKN